MHRDFKGIWLPREIWLAKDFSASEKLLWAEIHSLFDRKKGGCYASNEYLMEFVGKKKTRFHEMLAHLKKKGCVIQGTFEGRRILRAIVPDENLSPEEEKPSSKESGKEESAFPESGGPLFRNDGVRFSGPPIYKDDNKDKKKEEKGGASPPHPPPLSLPLKKENKIERAPHVFTTDREHQKIKEKVLTDENREGCYALFSEWKIESGKLKSKKSDYLCMLRWVVDTFFERKEKNRRTEKLLLKEGGPIQSAELRETTLQAIKKNKETFATFKAQNPVRGANMDVTGDFVWAGRYSVHFATAEPEFSQMLESMASSSGEIKVLYERPIPKEKQPSVQDLIGGLAQKMRNC